MHKPLLVEKVAVVTGGTRGIGKAIAKRFLEEEATVILIASNEETGRRALQELKDTTRSDRVFFYRADVSQTQLVEELFQTIFKEHQKVDILVNNAGITRDNLLMRLSEDDWDQVIEVNLKSAYNTSRMVFRPMMKARQGKIINITSVVGLMGNPGQTNYSASKAGLIGFTKALAKEGASRGICVNAIAPGFIETDMTNVLDEKQKEAILNQVPLQRLGKPEEIADAALFLASSMSDYMTGQVITVDGGLVI